MRAIHEHADSDKGCKHVFKKRQKICFLCNLKSDFGLIRPAVPMTALHMDLLNTESIRFIVGQQEDAHEFLIWLLDYMNEEK